MVSVGCPTSKGLVKESSFPSALPDQRAGVVLEGPSFSTEK